MRTVDTRESIRGVAAGVPYVALPPAQGGKGAPLVVAWRVYLGLLVLGSRLPEGGLDEFFRLFREDVVLNLFEPITRQAVEEFPAALAGLRERLAIGDGPLGLVGGSMGAWAALSALAATSAGENGTGRGGRDRTDVQRAIAVGRPMRAPTPGVLLITNDR